MRRLVVPIVLVALAASAAGASPAARGQSRVPAASTVTATTFLVTGRGYGHGVGMSQYGAYGYAQNGAAYDEILAHYYPGTTLGPAPATVMRVLLAEGRKSLAVASTVPYELEDAAGTIVELDAGTLRLGPGLVVRQQTLETPLIVRPGAGSSLRFGGKPYRGVFEVRSDGKQLALVNRLGLELYLQGVVPGEMPSVWPAEALKAQAVAARSYALASRVAGRSFDVYADVRSQVYGGEAIETPAAVDAVTATAGETLLFAGQPAKAFFYSTSGGRTAAAADVFGKPVPYLVSVPDPYDTLSPYHRWGPVAVPAAAVAKALAAAGVTDLVVSARAAGRAKTVVAKTPHGDVTVPATTVRAGLGLRSTWFGTGALTLRRAAKPVAYGGAAKLTASARGVLGAALQVRVAGAWQTVEQVPSGSLSVIVKPKTTALYRLATAVGQGPTMRVPVAPRVIFDGGAGTVTPALPGAAVVLESLDGEQWRQLGRTTIGEDGTYLFGVRLGAGLYRTRVPAAAGFAEGLSKELRLDS
jgi:stage II sporulation protein D